MDRIEEQQFAVLWPGGRSLAEPVGIAPGLSDLSGRTVAFVSDYNFRVDEMFALIEADMSMSSPGVRFVPASAFGDVHGHNEAAVIAAMPSRLRSEQVDAVVVGVGA